MVSARGAATDTWVLTDAGARLSVTWEGATPVEIRITVTMTMTMTVTGVRPTPVASRAVETCSSPGTRTDDVFGGIAAGALRYTLGCTALDVGEEQCCIVTDHRLLPLSWTLDAYYQAALLLACADGEPSAVVDVVDRHLAWLWGPGRDPAGIWRRSHLTTGAVKDLAYQADQQLFPMLELADFRRASGRWPRCHAVADWGALVRAVWTGLPRDPSGLVPGEENPADDPSGLPYLLSSQPLLAYTARRLAELAPELDLDDLGLRQDAERTPAVVDEVFTCPGPEGDQWAYETDGLSAHRLYHDANDVPTALAPLWGLCPADHPQWRATMRFAFSPDNPGYVTGPDPGLGSVHAPGVWPLGDAQEWAVAKATLNREAATAVVARLRLVASTDGMLPETYDARTGDWKARHWFAWPGALLGLLHRTIDQRTGPWFDPVDSGA